MQIMSVHYLKCGEMLFFVLISVVREKANQKTHFKSQINLILNSYFPFCINITQHVSPQNKLLCCI